MAKFVITSRAVVDKLLEALGSNHKLAKAFERNKAQYEKILREHVGKRGASTAPPSEYRGPKGGERWFDLDNKDKVGHLLDNQLKGQGRVVLPKDLFERMKGGVPSHRLRRALMESNEPPATFPMKSSRQKRKDPETLRKESKERGEFHQAVRRVYLDQQRRITGKKKVPGPAPRQGPPRLIRRERDQ